MHSVDIVWIVRDQYVGSSFFDATASQFILSHHRCRLQMCSAAANSRLHHCDGSDGDMQHLIPVNDADHDVNVNHCIAIINSTAAEAKSSSSATSQSQSSSIVQCFDKDQPMSGHHDAAAGAAIGPGWTTKYALQFHDSSKHGTLSVVTMLYNCCC